MKKLKNHTPLTKEEIKAFHERLKNGVESGGVEMLGYPPCTGCEPTSPNGACFEVNHVCVWIEEIG